MSVRHNTKHTPYALPAEMTDTAVAEIFVHLRHTLREGTAADRQSVYDYFMSRWQGDCEPIARLICFGETKAQHLEGAV